MAEEPHEPSKAWTAVKDALAPFFASNPYSRPAKPPKEADFLIEAMWGDDSVGVLVSQKEKLFIERLNRLILPERFSGLWHTDSNKYEIIFTAYRLPKRHAQLKDRSFEFIHSGVSYKCYFGQSSPELINIAVNFVPRAARSSTSYRLLEPYHQLEKFKAENIPLETVPIFDGAEPISFWVEGLHYNVDTILDLMNHLNFYMVYYDTQSPRIEIHSPRKESSTHQLTRFVVDGFPKGIIPLTQVFTPGY